MEVSSFPKDSQMGEHDVRGGDPFLPEDRDITGVTYPTITCISLKSRLRGPRSVVFD
jgi:hypothetical protein